MLLRVVLQVGYGMDTVGFIGVRYIFEALAKVNRTDVALRMLNVTAYPSFGWQITNNMEPATSLWESFDVPTMHQWVDESSRDHHYSASINTFLRKYLAGLDQPRGSTAWGVVKCRPEAIFYPDMLPTAAALLQSRRGPVGCSWRAAPVGGLPPPPPPPAAVPPVYCVITPMFTGAVRGPSPMVIRCPAGEVVTAVTYARWGTSSAGAPWFCWGPQPPPKGSCETDVSAKIVPLCVGKVGCNLSTVATQATLGGPCSGSQQLIVRVACAGKDVPAVRRGVRRQSPSGLDAEALAPGPSTEDFAETAAAAGWAVVNASVPGGSAGEVHVPLLRAGAGIISESGAVVWRDGQFVPGAAPGVSGGGSDGRFAWFVTRAGNYSFIASA